MRAWDLRAQATCGSFSLLLSFGAAKNNGTSPLPKNRDIFPSFPSRKEKDRKMDLLLGRRVYRSLLKEAWGNEQIALSKG